MREGNILLIKSKSFAIRCVRLYKFVCNEKNEYVLSKQLLRSGTSIGANIKESQFAQSRSDFAAKLSIAQKEAGESEYWIEVLEETGYLSKTQSESMLKDCRELLKLLQSITKKLYNK